MSICWEDKEQWIERLPNRFQVMFALFCAKQVIHLTNIVEAKVAVSTVERWLDGKATVEECHAAANAAAHANANAANANAANAANANAANAAAAHANAAHAYAVYAAYAAANAAAYTAHAKETKEQQIEYLRSLYLDSLPENERECWLVQACL